MSSACNICGSSSFGPGPGGRMSYDGRTAPRCNGCQSLERHRAFRDLFLRLRDDRFARASALQFSRDRSCEASWFGRHELSDFEGANPLDLQAIDRPDGAYDVVVCNHVIEHVERDRDAMRELLRVLKGDGFLFLSFPDPLRRPTTAEWGYPDPAQHGHYRLYGADVREKFAEELPGASVVRVVAVDPVTGAQEGVFLVSPSAAVAASLLERCAGVEAELIQPGHGAGAAGGPAGRAAGG